MKLFLNFIKNNKVIPRLIQIYKDKINENKESLLLNNLIQELFYVNPSLFHHFEKNP